MGTSKSLYYQICDQCKELAFEVMTYMAFSQKIKRQLTPAQIENAFASVEMLVLDAFRAHALHPYAPVSISKRPSSYSSKQPEYRGVPYRTVV